MFYLFLAACVLAVLIKKFTPDNSVRAKMERLLATLPDFDPVFRVEDLHNRRILAMDPNASQFAVVDAGKPIRVFGFHELVEVEVVRDGITIEKSNRGSQVMRAAVGGALLGPAGLLIGGLTGSKRQKGSVTRLVLKITVSDLHSPVIDIVFLDTAKMVHMRPAKGVKSDRRPVEERMADWYGRFRIILHGQSSSPAKLSPVAPSALPAPFGRRRGLLASEN